MKKQLLLVLAAFSISSISFASTSYQAPAYVPPAPVKAETPVPAPAPAPVKDYYFDSIYFNVDQSDIRPSEVAKADHFVQTALEHPEWKFKLAGNTDSTWTADYNYALSQRRVQGVKNYALARGVKVDQFIDADYNGFTKPVASNTTEYGRQENRRTDIWLVK